MSICISDEPNYKLRLKDFIPFDGAENYSIRNSDWYY